MTQYDNRELGTMSERVVGGTVTAEGENVAVPAPSAPAAEPAMVARAAKTSALRDLRSLDPDARIPTGPGVPTWEWLYVDLAWSGPVEAQQTLRLWLISPFFARVLSFARVLLLAALCFAALRRAAPSGGAPALARFAVSTAALLLTLASPEFIVQK